MATETVTLTAANVGCWLDNHRGHYISRDVILLAADSFGYILGPLERWFLDCYEDHNGDDNYPAEIVHEIQQDVENWLNGGPNEGPDRAIKFQNSPPLIPASFAWGFNDGDFGLYPVECECGADGGHLTTDEMWAMGDTPWYEVACTH